MEQPTGFIHTPIILCFEVDLDLGLDDLTLFSEVSSPPRPKASRSSTQVVFPPITHIASNIVNRVTSYLSQPSTPVLHNSPVIPRASSRKKQSRACFWHKLYTFLEPLAQAAEEPSLDESFETQANLGLQQNPLVLCPEGVGGTYFLLNQDGEKLGVFKPIDEEPGAPGNPKKLVTKPLLPPGGGAIREVAAFALDKGWAGVPPTYLANNIETRIGTKSGSVQKFMTNDGDSTSVGSSTFVIDDVHRIGILDIRLVNMDRNGENILIKHAGDHHHLIPIDHAYILPEKINGDCFFEWMHWSQAKMPFSQQTLDYIAKIELEADASVLRDLGIPEESIQTMLISSLFLKHCARIGKNLFEIAVLMCRDHTGAPSQLEVLVERAQKEFKSADSFNDTFQSLLQQTLI